jgi:DNA replication and repair protein RecF
MDDISGELDENRWNKLISYLESLNLQVIITTANKKFKEKLVKLNSVKLLNVTEGNIEDI